MNNGRSVVWPTVLITAGIVFLLSNLGVITVDLWNLISKFWPVIFILAGIDLLFFKRGSVGSYIVVLIVLAVVGSASWASNKFNTRVGFGETVEVQISQSIDAIEEVDMHIEMNVGELNVESQSLSDTLIEGVIGVGENEDVTDSLEVNGSSATYYLTTEGIEVHNVFDFPGFDNDSNLSWDLGITDSLPVDLRISSGVSEANIDLTGLTLVDFDFDGGVGEATITFPEEGTFESHIDIGVGSVTVYLPEGLSVKIITSIGIGDTSVRGDYMANGSDRYESPDFDSATGVTLYVDGGIGDVNIIQAP